MRKWLLYALSVLLLVLGGGFLLARFTFHLFSGTLACNTWRSMALAQPDGTNQFTSVALLSANDVWLAGENFAPGAQNRPLVEHWNGHTWQALFPLDPGAVGGNLDGIAAISDSDVWVVGSTYTTPADLFPLAEHWDGHTWRLLPSFKFTGYHGFSKLTGVTALASDDVWAVGSAPGGGFTQTLVEHWDGSAWRRVPSPNVADENNQFASISALSANNIWAVGTSQGYYGSQLTLTEHWDGSRWSIVQSPDPSRTANALSSVAVAWSNDVWAVGVMLPNLTSLTSAGGYQQARDPVQFETEGLIEHWDGQKWQVVSFPKKGEHLVLLSVTAYSSLDVWAAGFFVVDDSQQGQVFHGLLLHWDGSAWHSTEDPRAQYIDNIATSAAGGLWSTGLTVPPRNSGARQQAVVEACS